MANNTTTGKPIANIVRQGSLIGALSITDSIRINITTPLIIPTALMTLIRGL
ncbi:hypothetical protein ACFLW0_04305 [Chloroflexota bacterium]